MFEFHTDIATLQGNRYIQGNGIAQNYFFLQQKVMQHKLRYFKQIVGLIFFFKDFASRWIKFGFIVWLLTRAHRLMQGREQQTSSTTALGRQRRATASCEGQPFWKKRGNGVPSTEGTQNTTPPPSLPPYLGRGAGGEVGQVPDPGSCPRVAGADEDGCADLHGVPVAGGLGGLVRHAEGSEGMAFLGVLLALRLTLGRPGRPGTGQRGARCQTCRCCRRRCLHGQRHVATGGGSRARLVHLDELLGGFIQLAVEEKRKTKKKEKIKTGKEGVTWTIVARLMAPAGPAWAFLPAAPWSFLLVAHPGQSLPAKRVLGTGPKTSRVPSSVRHLSVTPAGPQEAHRRVLFPQTCPRPSGIVQLQCDAQLI